MFVVLDVIVLIQLVEPLAVIGLGGEKGDSFFFLGHEMLLSGFPVCAGRNAWLEIAAVQNRKIPHAEIVAEESFLR